MSNPFDPSCDFLLAGNRDSLFESVGGTTDGLTFRCKGCRKLLPRWQRVEHGQMHVREVARREERRKEEAKIKRLEAAARAREEKKRSAA